MRPSAPNPEFALHSSLVKSLPLAGLLGAVLLGFAAGLAGQEKPPPVADDWLRSEHSFPSWVSPSQIKSNGFPSLHAEVIAEKLKVLCRTPNDPRATAKIIASQDRPGHWPARDWHAYPMSRAGEVWEVSLPVEDLDIPMIYFLSSVEAGSTNISEMRVCNPLEAGLQWPTRLFWAFLEGFENGFENWGLLDADVGVPPLTTSPLSKSGRASLLVTPASGRKKSTTIGTTLLRGTKILSVGATGVTCWMRTVQGRGRARFTLYANAFTTNQIAATSTVEPSLTSKWEKSDVPFNSFNGVPLASVDYFTIELIPDTALGFLIDDVQFLGPWKTD